MMKKIKNFKIKAYFSDRSGVVALGITIIVLFVGSVIVLSLVFVFLNRLEAARNILLSEQAYFAAESGIEDALLRFLDPAKTIPASAYTLNVASGIATITPSAGLNNVQYFDSDGDISNRIRSLNVAIGVDPLGTTFSFSAQIGVRGLTMDANSTINGNVYSNQDVTGGSSTLIGGNADAVGTISSPNPTVTGTSTEGVDSVPLPPFDEEGWSDAANINNDPIIGDLTLGSGTTFLGPREIQGNLTLNSNAELVVTGPLHITGNFIMNSNTDIRLDNSFGSDGTVVWAENLVQFNAKSEADGTSANPKGYIMFVSTSFSNEAIKLVSNSSQEAALYAVNGDVVVDSNGDVTALIGNGVYLKSKAEINFDLGLITYTFSSGGTGGYFIFDWKEQ